MKTRYQELTTTIHAHNDAYYRHAAPTISDREYDRLYAELLEIEAAHPEWVTPDSPSQRVGQDNAAGFKTVDHIVPMQSLENTYNEADVTAFLDRIDATIRKEALFVVDPKIDGLAVEVWYRKGKFTRAATRGDGTHGDEITVNVATIASLPKTLPRKVDISVRGEIFFTKADFAKANAERLADGQEAFANARNAAAGSIKLLDSAEVAKRPLSIILHSSANTFGQPFETQMEMLETLKDLGIPTSDLNISGYAHEIPAIIQNMDKLRKKLPYETDGAVIKIDRFERREELGSTSKAPRWAFAFKYETEKAETTLKAVTWQVGRTGNITPVAELEPVLVAGSTVARATLHNIEEIRRKDLKIGDRVLIEKAGEVIPAVIGPLKEKRTGDEKDIDSPLKCPICDQRTLLDGIFVRCTNGDCPEQIVGRLLHFAQRTAMDIEGLGDTIAYGLVSIVGIKSPADLYTLTETQLLTIPRMGDKVAQKILKNIRASKDRGLRAVLFALGIPNASEGTAKRLLEVYDTIDQIAEASVEDLQKIRDVGPIVAQSIHDFLRTPRGRQLVEDLRQHGVKLAAERKAAASAKLAGKIFVITGILSQPRNHFQALIESHGGRCSDSISKNTSYLLAGSDAGSKLAKAEKLKVPIIDEDFLITLLASELPA